MALTPKVRAFLEEKRFAVLATINDDGLPQQTVMWYALEGDQVMMNTARGRRKDRNLLRDRRVSICIEDAYRFVTIAGEVELIEEQERGHRDIHALAVRYHGEQRAAEMMRNGFSKQVRITMLLPTDNVITAGFSE